MSQLISLTAYKWIMLKLFAWFNALLCSVFSQLAYTKHKKKKYLQTINVLLYTFVNMKMKAGI